MDTQNDREFDLLYAELRRLAGAAMRGERASHTLQPTALLHDYLLTLDDFARATGAAREEFLWKAYRKMRQMLVDHARRRKAKKRDPGERVPLNLDEGEANSPVPFDAIDLEAGESDLYPDLVRLDALLVALKAEQSEWAKVIILTYFVGAPQATIALELKCSVPTVQRYLRHGKDWLRRKFSEALNGEVE